jgi:adenosine deaminase CECR1
MTNYVDVYPGMMFSLARERMEKSRLWKIVRRMPKGALLHCHLEAMVDFDWTMELALETEGVCIAADRPLDGEENRLKGRFSFTYSKVHARDDVSIWTDKYEANTPIPLKSAAESFPEGEKQGFIEWVRCRTSITADEHLAHHEGPNEIWRKFMSCFPILGSLIFYEPIFRKFVYRMCQQLMDDGVYYLEMRSAFVTPYRCAGNEDIDEDYFNLLSHLEEEIERFKASEEGRNFWGGRVIWTTVRHFNTKDIITGTPKHSPNLCIY